jgi:hypothetical protein
MIGETAIPASRRLHRRIGPACRAAENPGGARRRGLDVAYCVLVEVDCRGWASAVCCCVSVEACVLKAQASDGTAVATKRLAPRTSPTILERMRISRPL